MKIGQKHKYCGKINWNEKSCNCSAYQHASKNITVPCTDKELFLFEEVIFDHLAMEKFGDELQKIATRMNMNIDIDYHPNFDAKYEDDIYEELPAISIDNWLYVYPEKVEEKTLFGTEFFDGFALDIEVVEHNYPHEPDSVNYDHVCVMRNINSLIKKILLIIWEQHYNNLTEALYYEELTLEDTL